MASLLIVGAGLTSLVVANRLREAGRQSITVLDKSRGVGGRMATRRSDTAKFDHGAQFYSLRPEITPLHERWQAAGLVEPWFEANGSMRMRAPAGMTSLAKNLSEGLDLKLGQEVASLERAGGGWCLRTKGGESFEADRVLLTCPMPQALALLKNSAIPFDPKLSAIIYAKALVGLFEGVTASIPLPAGYLEKPNAEIQSVADQRAKGVSPSAAWTVTMSPEFSERYFEEEDSVSTELLVQAVRKLDSSFAYSSLQLKKWRYSHPLERAEGEYSVVAPGLVLAGDAFGRPSLNGAAASAEAVARHLIST